LKTKEEQVLDATARTAEHLSHCESNGNFGRICNSLQQRSDKVPPVNPLAELASVGPVPLLVPVVVAFLDMYRFSSNFGAVGLVCCWLGSAKEASGVFVL